jgi:hypothetical protein
VQIVFQKACECAEAKALLPTPHLHSYAPTRKRREVLVDISFECPVCHEHWRFGMALPSVPESLAGKGRKESIDDFVKSIGRIK